MQQNPTSNPSSGKRQKDHTRRDAVLRKLHSIFLENWGTKLLAVFIAVALWAGLITQDPTLSREKQFNGVAVNITGAETLKRNGFIVLEDLDLVLGDVNVRVEVPQNQYTNVTSSNYSIRVELSRINSAGVQDVKIMSTNSSTYGTVLEIDPPAVKLTVDEYVTRYRIPVTVVTEGEAPEGFYASAPSIDPPMIAVSGPKSVVNQIACAQVVVDQSALPAKDGTVRRALPFTLVDDTGAAIQSDMLQVTSESVLLDSLIVEQAVYSQRTLELSEMGLVVGQPAEGYEIKGVYITPSTITIAGRSNVISEIGVLYADSTVNVSGLKESVNKAIRVRQPSTLKYVSTDQVTVAVEIGPVITTRAYEVQVELYGLAANLREVGGLRVASVLLTGAQPWLDSLSSVDVKLSCDMGSIAEPGTYVLPITCTVEGSEGQSYTCEINPASVVVTVIGR